MSIFTLLIYTPKYQQKIYKEVFVIFAEPPTKKLKETNGKNDNEGDFDANYIADIQMGLMFFIAFQ